MNQTTASVARLTLVLFIVACADETTNVIPPPPAPVTEPSLSRLEFEPLVVRRGVGTTRLSVLASGSSVGRLEAIEVSVTSIYSGLPPHIPHPIHRLLIGGQSAEIIVLRDDGSNGDAAAGDGVYSSPPLVPVDEAPPAIAGFFPWFITRIRHVFADTVIDLVPSGDSRYQTFLLDVDPAKVPPVATVEVGTTARRTPHVVSIALAREGNPAVLRLSGPELAREYYNRFRYDPDFLIGYQLHLRAAAGPAAYYQPARSHVEGIGVTPFDGGQYEGIGPRLKGAAVIYGGPNPSSHALVEHEVLHQWAAYLHPDLGITSNSHWLPGVFDRPSHGFGHGRYNDVELYLMGLLPADSVDPRRIGTNGTTIDDLIARHGLRTPRWPETQREFTLATVVVYHRLLTADELALFEYLAAEFGQEHLNPGRTDPTASTFFESTGGRARMATLIPADAAR